MRVARQKTVQVRGVPLERWMAARRRRRFFILALAVIVLAMMSGLQIVRHSGRYEAATRVTGNVTAVEDGRTLRVTPDGGGAAIVVQLLGVTVSEAKEDAARRWLTAHAAGKSVIISFDRRANRYDAASRLRGYVYTPDGRMLNEELLVLGLARVDASEGFSLKTWFTKVQSRAKPGASAASNPPPPVTIPMEVDEDD